MKKTVVKTYKSRRRMQWGINRMGKRGYHVHSQSGQFERALTFKRSWQKKGVTVVFELREQPAAS
jgi:hypothetical protein